MNNLLKKLTVINATGLFFLSSYSYSFAITFSWDSYTGVVVRTIVENGLVTQTVYAEINNKPFTQNDIYGDLGHELTESYDGIEVYVDRGKRDFDSDTTELNFGTSVLKFEEASDSEYALGESFKLGTLTFTNGFWIIDPYGSHFDFTITASSTKLGAGDQEFNGTLSLYTNSNGLETPEERADWFYIQQNPELGSVRVYESMDFPLVSLPNTGSVDVYGKFGSLNLVEFRNPTGGAFLNTSTTSDLAPVPEPSTMLLFGTGIAGLAAVGRRRRKK